MQIDSLDCGAQMRRVIGGTTRFSSLSTDKYYFLVD